MRVFLTGGTGFLGQHVAQQLLERGHQVLALARKPERAKRLETLGAKIILGTLPQTKDLQEALRDIDAVIHVAGVVKALSAQDFLHVNRDGAAYLVQEILKMKTLPKRFIHISTIAVNNPKINPDFCQPAKDCKALTYYGESKRQGELALDPLKNKVPVSTLRPPVLYGPYDTELLSLFKSIQHGIAPLLQNGARELSICFGPDVADAIVRMTEHPIPLRGIYCLDDGHTHTWRSLSEAIAKVLNKQPYYLKIPKTCFRISGTLSTSLAKLTGRPQIFTLNKLKEMFSPRWVCGFEKLNQELHWQPSTNLTTGMQNTLEFYRQENWL